MTLWQLRRIARLFNREPSRSIRALQVFEPIDRNTRRPSRELQKARFPLWWPAPHTLPEPLNNFIVDFVSSVVCEFGPVIAIKRYKCEFKRQKWVKWGKGHTHRSRTFHR